MKRRLAATIAVIVVSSHPAWASGYFYTGVDAYEWCVKRSHESVMLAHCSGYVAALLDQAAYDGYVACLSPDATISAVRDAFGLYLASHPNDLSIEAPALFYLAMMEAFPC